MTERFTYAEALKNQDFNKWTSEILGESMIQTHEKTIVRNVQVELVDLFYQIKRSVPGITPDGIIEWLDRTPPHKDEVITRRELFIQNRTEEIYGELDAIDDGVFA